LLDLINDLLDVSKAEAGKLELHEEELDLGELVDTCLRLLAPAADKAKVHLEDPASKQTFKLNADDRKLRQILINLLSNAMKFTPEGGSVSITYAGDPDGGVTISVSDSGIGMTPEQLEKALHPFVQIEQGYDSNVQGTGLGLPLSKTLAELHGGRLQMQSAPGKGTTAIVHLPAERLIATKKPRKRAAA
jgi:signal transduction histidine kinase